MILITHIGSFTETGRAVDRTQTAIFYDFVVVQPTQDFFTGNLHVCRFCPFPFDMLVDLNFSSLGGSAMRFMMFIKHREDYRMEDVPQSLFDAMGEFVGESMKNGSVIDTAGLQPTAKGKRVRLSGGKLSVIDGPFVETKEVVGGYALVEAKSYDEALALATRFMDLHRIHWPKFEGECEVRPLENMEPAK
jgi:hypothetical protein